MRGYELFLTLLRDFTKAANFSAAFEKTTRRAEAEILGDMRRDPRMWSCRRYSQLHDFVDANYYGGAFDWRGPLGTEGDDEYAAALFDFWDRVQAHADRWLRAGSHLARLGVVPGRRVRLRTAVERFPSFTAPAGLTGVVASVADCNGVPWGFVSVRMDDPLPGAEERGNEIHWYDATTYAGRDSTSPDGWGGFGAQAEILPEGT